MCLITQILFLFSHMCILVHSFMYFLLCVRVMGQKELNILHFAVMWYISIRFLATLDNNNCNSFQDHNKFSFVCTNSVEKLNRLFIGYYWRKYSHKSSFDFNILIEWKIKELKSLKYQYTFPWSLRLQLTLLEIIESWETWRMYQEANI